MEQVQVFPLHRRYW